MALSWKGHTVWTEVRDRRDEFPQMGQAAVKFWAVCSCGYRSTVRATEDTATAAALTHLWRVTMPTSSRSAFLQELRRHQGAA